MHTDSSASLTYFASLSASECTMTVLIPSSRQARWMRRAISPRLAMRTFLNIAKREFRRRIGRIPENRARASGWRARARIQDSGVPTHSSPPHASIYDHQRLAILDRLAIFHEYRFDDAVLVALDLGPQLHRLDDADGVARLDRVAHLDKVLGARRGRAVESAHHGRFDQDRESVVLRK